jgi:predicted  nucleic acid-binding Zn-ribbon protein
MQRNDLKKLKGQLTEAMEELAVARGEIGLLKLEKQQMEREIQDVRASFKGLGEI